MRKLKRVLFVQAIGRAGVHLQMRNGAVAEMISRIELMVLSF